MSSTKCVLSCSPPPVSKRLFSECTSRGTRKPTNIYEEENIAGMIQTNPRIRTWRISTNLNILCLTVGWMWQTEGRIRTTFGAFGNVNLLHCTVGWNFATGLMLNPQRFLIYLLIRLIFFRNGVNNTRKSYLQKHVNLHGRVRFTIITFP
jgi:hypothetical protein